MKPMTFFIHQIFSSFVFKVCHIQKRVLSVGSAVQQVVINPQLFCDSLLLFREKTKNAEMVSVFSDVFGKINHRTFPVPAVDKIIDDGVLFFFFAHQVLKQNNQFFGCSLAALRAK